MLNNTNLNKDTLNELEEIISYHNNSAAGYSDIIFCVGCFDEIQGAFITDIDGGDIEQLEFFADLTSDSSNNYVYYNVYSDSLENIESAAVKEIVLDAALLEGTNAIFG